MPSNWTTYKLEDALEILIDYRGKTPKKTNSGIPLVTARIVKNGFIQEPTEFISKEDYSNWMTRGIPELGDVVLTVEAPLGEVADIVDKNVALAQRIITLRGKEDVLDSGFLKYYLMSATGQAKLKERETGTTVTGIKQSELRQIEIECPPYKIQKEIANILNPIEEKIRNNFEITTLLESLTSEMFSEWFIRFRYPNRSESLVESELGLIPENWQVISLNDVIKIKHGFAFKGEFFSDEETNDVLLTPGNFKIGGGFNYEKFKFYNASYPADYILNKGDLIVTMTDLSKEGDTLGYPALVPKIANKKLLHNQRIGKVEFIESNIIKNYLYLLMKQSKYRNFILGTATGTTVRHTSPSRIGDFKTILPDKKLLNYFNDLINPIIEAIDFSYSENEQLLMLRDNLLPKLIKGQIIS